MDVGRTVVAAAGRHRIECDGEEHWYVDTQGTGLSVEPPRVVGQYPLRQWPLGRSASGSLVIR